MPACAPITLDDPTGPPSRFPWLRDLDASLLAREGAVSLTHKVSLSLGTYPTDVLVEVTEDEDDRL